MFFLASTIAGLSTIKESLIYKNNRKENVLVMNNDER